MIDNEDVVYRLPDSAIFKSPIYIHSHAYTFYNQISLRTASQNAAVSQVKELQTGVTQILRDNIKKLQEVHDAYSNAGIDLSLMDLHNSFLELKELKPETLTQNTISGVVSSYRRKLEEKIISKITQWVDGPITDQMTEELYTIINKEIDNINKTVTGEKIDLVDLSSGESIKKLTTILRRYKTLSEKKEGAKWIAEKIAAKLINAKKLDAANLISDLAKTSTQVRIEDIKNYLSLLDALNKDKTWTTGNALSKIQTISDIFNSTVGKGVNIFKKGMPKQIGGMLGHVFELEIVKLLKDYNVQLAAKAKENLIELTIPDITGQIYQTASHNITTDVDLGIRLKGMTEFTYGISAKTLTKGMKFKSKQMDKLFSEPVSNETWHFIFYILLNYYALKKYNVGDRNVSANFLGSNLIESVMQAIFMVEAAGSLLGNCFIEYQGSTNSKSLLEIIEEETALGKAVSMPIILMFPNNTIYTVDLLEKIFNEFSKSAEGVINQKYLADYSPVRSWQLKQELLTRYDGTSEDQEGQLYEMLSKPGSEWLVDIGEGNPFDGNWFTFAGTYNKDWLTK